jgi:hypothetical protein
VSLLRRTGPFAGPVRLFCLLQLLFLAAPADIRSASRRPRVRDSILGIRIGSTLADASTRLDPLAIRREREAEEEEPEREEGRQKAWMLKSTEYRSVALKVNDADRVVWITGFVRPGKEIPFSRLGDLSTARVNDSIAIWNVRTPAGSYRLVARGRGRRATVISLLSLDAAPGD